jgi:cyclase
MLQGVGGNIAASVGDDGIAIVDDQFAPLAEKIRAALKDITGKDKPVRFVINTHYHGDHTGGNLNFSATSTIIAQDNVRERLAAPAVTAVQFTWITNLWRKPHCPSSPSSTMLLFT